MITPQEAYQKAKPSENELKNLENIIDSAIVKGLQTKQNKVYIGATIFPNKITCQEIISKYRAAGWRVNYITDDREGDYISIAQKDHSRD